MADNFSQGCIGFKVSTEQEKYLRRVEGLMHALIDEDGTALTESDADLEDGDEDFANAVSQRLMEMGIGDLEPFEFGGDLTIDIEGSGDDRMAYLYGDEYMNTGAAAEIVCGMLQATNDDRVITGEWSYTCSKPRPGEFGGGCFAVSKSRIEFGGTSQLAEQLAKELTETPLAEQVKLTLAAWDAHDSGGGSEDAFLNEMACLRSYVEE